MRMSSFVTVMYVPVLIDHLPQMSSGTSSNLSFSVPGPGAGVSPEQDANAKRVNAHRSAMMSFFMRFFSFVF